MTAQEQAFERYAARVGAHWTDAQRAEARRGYLDGLADNATERARNSESYAPPNRGQSESAPWEAHLATLENE